jgi:serine/threonine-protein kinase
MLRAGQVDGIDPDITSRHDVTISLAPASSSVLARVAETIGGLPRILLRDTDPGEEPSPLVQPGSAEMPAPSERPDRYQLFGEIAHGGMGAVLRGRDSDLGRDLAVKVLLESHRDKPDLVRRFIEEAQIGGQLQHPGVVPVYDIGAFADHRPFFTMKLVKGRTLAAILGERGRVSAPSPPQGERGRVSAPSSSLRTTPGAGATGLASDRPRLLSIFEQVCQTMAYAHTRGVIHRDLKPSNIMVGSFGEVQVMDWGLAKVLPRGGVADDAGAGKEDDHETVVATARSGSSTELSQAGSVLGTPAYMAPEQARGEIDRLDERADVFALGSILCEILTGEPAFTGRTSSEILRKAGRGDLDPALARLDACDAERELIGLAQECLAPERDDRPQSARVVAEAMTAYLAGVQERLRAAELARVEADARAVFERKRRRLTLALAASIIGTILVAGGGWALNERQRQERQRERQERAQRVELPLREAQLLHGQAERAGDDRDHWIAAVDAARALERLAGDADEPSRQAIGGLVKAVIEGAAAAERDRQLLDRLRVIYSGGFDDPDGSVTDAMLAAAFREAAFDVDILDPKSAAERIRARPPKVVQEVAVGLDSWALLRRRTRPREPEASHRLEAAARAADPDLLRNRLRDIWSAADAKVRHAELLELARHAAGRGWPLQTLLLLSQALVHLGDDDARLELLRRVQLDHPESFEVNFWLGLAFMRAHPKQEDEAIRFLSVARVLQPDSGHTLAHLLEGRGRWDEARAIYEELTRRLPGDGQQWVCLGTFLRARGEREAGAALARAITITREQLRLDPAFPHGHCSLARALVAEGKVAEAIAEFREAIRLKPDDLKAHVQLGDALRGQGRADDAIAEFQEAIRLWSDDVEARLALGALLCDVRHEYAAATAEFRTVIRLQPDLATAHYYLGNALRGQGKVAEAIGELRNAIRLNPNDVGPHQSLGSALCDVMHDYGAAVAEFRTSIQLQPDNAASHVNLGNALRGDGRMTEAIREFRESIRLVPDRADAHIGLGAILCDVVHDYDGAAAEFRQAMRLQPESVAANINLSVSLAGSGEFTESLEILRRARSLARTQPELHRLTEHLLIQIERQARLAARLPAVLRGEQKPPVGAEAAEFAQVTFELRHYAASAELYAQAFRAGPPPAEALLAAHRYDAARAAAMAGAGMGHGQPRPDAPARTRWRQQALDWLRASLAFHAKRLESDAAEAKAQVRGALEGWKLDRELAGIRDEAPVATLPEPERKACRALWAEVDKALKACEGGSP